MSARRVLDGLLAAWLIASIWLGSDSGLSVAALLVIVYGAVLVFIGWLITVVIAWWRRERLRRVWIEPAVTLAVLAIISSGAPFRLRFVVSRPFLDQYVARTIAAGQSHRTRTRVGLFVARETEVLPNGGVRIITTPCMFDECGLAFSGTEPPRVDEDYYDRVADNWWRWLRSW